MRLLFLTVVRNWRSRKFLTILLVVGYTLGISAAVLSYSAVAGSYALQVSRHHGDPDRTLDTFISNPAIRLDPQHWLKGIDVDWGWVFISNQGRELSPSFGHANVVAMFANTEIDWSPPVQKGRFLSAADIIGDQQVIVRGNETASEPTGYQELGVVYEKPGEEEGWGESLFVPFGALPPALIENAGNGVVLHLVIAKGEDVVGAKERLEANLRQAFPQGAVTVQTTQDMREAVSGQYQGIWARGIGFSVLVLLFVCANVSVLTMHWMAQRRREIGVRMALGATKGSVWFMVVGEQQLLALVGALLSIPVMLAGSEMASRFGIPLPFSLGTTVVMAVATLLTGWLSSAVPLYLFLRAPLWSSLQHSE